MDAEQAMRGRRSIRAYDSRPVSEELVREVLDEARWAPSWRNTQPWNVWVLRGAALERFKQTFRDAAGRDEPARLDLAAPTHWPAACSVRTAELMKTRAASLEAAGEPTDPAASLARMSDLFGAPCLLVFGFEECLAEAYASFDTGALVQSVCLAAHARGLGTCIMATVVRYPDLIRELLPGAESKRIVVSVTLGYPDLEAAANVFSRSRAPLDELVTWVE